MCKGLPLGINAVGLSSRKGAERRQQLPLIKQILESESGSRMWAGGMQGARTNSIILRNTGVNFILLCM